MEFSEIRVRSNQVRVVGSLILSLLMINGQENHVNLEGGQIHYIYNSKYPDYGGNDSIWNLTSPFVITLTCALEMKCDVSKFLVKYAGKSTSTYCGNGTFVSKGLNPIIQFITKCESCSRFICEIKTDDDTCHCGWKKVTRIVGGEETKINEFPPMAGLVDLQDKEIFCGGTIISPRYVITAAHCVKNRNVTQFGIVVGEHDVSTGSDTNAAKLFPVANYTIHPKYQNTGEPYNDVAVCQIVGIIEYSYEIGPACLPFQHTQYAGSIVIALGWGTLEFMGEKPTALQKVDLNVISNQECANYYTDYNIDYSHVCTFTPGKDTCQMDSGGPLIWQNPETNRLILVGTTSSGAGCASKKPAIAMRVKAFIDWIMSVTPGEQYCNVE